MRIKLIALLSFLHSSIATIDVGFCSCGFLDPRTGAVWTDTILTYANETATLPTDALVAEDFQHASEKNWNAHYRAGASANNIVYSESIAPGWSGGAWQLNINRPTRQHAVVGASIRSIRRDIRYGTFEVALRAPPPGVGGSVLSMRLDYNESQSLDINVMNANDPKDAWTSFMMSGDWRGARSKGVNFTDFSNSTYNYPTSPWEFVPYRIDWTDKKANYFIGDSLARSIVIRETTKQWPTTPSTLYIRHLSVGDAYTSEGPPLNGSFAHVGVIRAFFNSSLMSKTDRITFDTQCRGKKQCLVTDTSLRGSSVYSIDATQEFKELPEDYKKRWPAILVACTSLAISTILLIHALIKRALWATEASIPMEGPDTTTTPSGVADQGHLILKDLSSMPNVLVSEGYGLTGGADSLGNVTPGAVTPGVSTPGTMTTGDYLPSRKISSTSLISTSGPDSGYNSSPTTKPPSRLLQVASLPVGTWNALRDNERMTQTRGVEPGSTSVEELDPKKRLSEVQTKDINGCKKPAAGTKPPSDAPKQRVDYLAGLVALASILITLIHFCLTFLPATVIPHSHAHYASEIWALKTVAPYLLTFSWIGPFFTSSTRFLVMTYLKSGNLKGVAEKTVGRTPRLVIPCAAIATFEYFCMQVGAIVWLEHLPSVTWSSWPYAASYATVWHFVGAIIELMYIIPNAVPQITFNYCIGVLWTIPVQLQNSWTSLLAVIVIREIKTPWKRMCYYAFCIINHWYAMSWGSFFWVGLLIADLDISYNWKTWLYARPMVYYPFIAFIVLLAFGSPSIDLVGLWTTFNFNTLEYGIHPHQRSGRFIRESLDYEYPPYYIPRLTALTFAFGLHLLVELSPIVQKVLSNHLLMWMFPHILTLYLIHGLIFWSLGATICVKLASRGVPYWANMLVVATCSYTVIFACLPILTPILETLGKSITSTIWRNASEEPNRRKDTLFPFSAAMLQGGEKNVAKTKLKSKNVEESEG